MHNFLLIAKFFRYRVFQDIKWLCKKKHRLLENLHLSNYIASNLFAASAKVKLSLAKQKRINFKSFPFS